MKIDVPDGALKVISQLEDAGYAAFLVGGCIRDSLLGRTPKDWDICTAASPAQVLGCFPHERTLETGMNHGTVTIILNNEMYEVSAFRAAEWGKPGNTLQIEDDLSRRDFTINAMAYHPHAGLIDPFGGQQDLERGQIRCVGDPTFRFIEDPLRVLRAIRFFSVYGFAIDPRTSKSVQAFAPMLKKVSPERIQKELMAALKGENFLSSFLLYPDVFSSILPELTTCIGFNQNNPWHIYDVYEHIGRAVVSYVGEDLAIKLALLLHDIGKPACYVEDENGIRHFPKHGEVSGVMAGKALRRLRFDRKTIETVQELVLYHDAELQSTPKNVRRWLNRIGETRLRQLIEVKQADNLAQAPDKIPPTLETLTKFSSLMEQVLTEKQCFSLQDLKIDGNDLLSMGVPQGKNLGALLGRLMDEVVEGTLENQREFLIDRAKELVHQMQ